MAEPVRIALYADLSCPFAYLIAYRWRRLRAEYAGRVEIAHMSLALEYVNQEPTPKHVLDVELPILLVSEPDIPYAPWHAPVSEWPVTFWPAFEAVKCAERQSLTRADDLAWAIRTAFFAESRCVSMRHVLLGLAESVDVEMDRFIADFDSGIVKHLVVEEARAGWEQLKTPGSPTLVLPSGEQISELGLPELELDADRHQRPTLARPAACSGDGCLDLLRELFDGAERG